MKTSDLYPGLGKASKKQAVEAYNRLLAALKIRSDDTSPGINWDDNEVRHCMSVLYGTFQPALPATARTPFQLCEHYVAKNDVRSYLNAIYSDGEYLIGCNGHVGARVQMDGTVAEGYYDHSGNAAYCCDRYVDNIHKLFNDTDGCQEEPSLSFYWFGDTEYYGDEEKQLAVNAGIARKILRDFLEGKWFSGPHKDDMLHVSGVLFDHSVDMIIAPVRLMSRDDEQ